MLERYDKKRVRVTLYDGEVLSGAATHYAPGYGLHVFDREEESLLVGSTFVFKTDIRRIEAFDDAGNVRPDDAPRRFDDLMGELIEGPYRVADVLPRQVPKDAPGQYFAVERWYLQPERLTPLRRRFASILLRLNCYDDMAVTFDACESWETNPDPEAFAAAFTRTRADRFFRAVFPEKRAMIDVEPEETYLTVYDPDGAIAGTVDALAAAEGLFVWAPPDGEV